MKKAILYIHGKGGSSEEAEHYKPICAGYHMSGLDYPSSTPWEAKDEIRNEYERLRRKYDSILVIANSIGAYFAMHALADEKIEKAFFISPVVDMETLIRDMMAWANVTEQELFQRQEIETSFGETLSWRYFCYAKDHPLVWNVPTEILYAEKDHLTSYNTISRFVKQTGSGLTVMKNGEHWFHTEEQMAFLDDWLKRVI